MYNTFPLKRIAFVVTKVNASKMKGDLSILYDAAEKEVNSRIDQLAETYHQKGFVILDISDHKIDDDVIRTRIVYQYNASVDTKTGELDQSLHQLEWKNI